MKTNSISKKLFMITSIIVMIIASFSTISINAQTEVKIDNVQEEAESLSLQGCYTVVILYCLRGEHLICNFNNVYGKPYECTEFHCDHSSSHRECVLVKS